MKRKITKEEFDRICQMLNSLNDILQEVGIAEFSVSLKKKEIFWDTANGGMINPKALNMLEGSVDTLTEEMLMAKAEGKI